MENLKNYMTLSEYFETLKLNEIEFKYKGSIQRKFKNMLNESTQNTNSDVISIDSIIYINRFLVHEQIDKLKQSVLVNTIVLDLIEALDVNRNNKRDIENIRTHLLRKIDSYSLNLLPFKGSFINIKVFEQILSSVEIIKTTNNNWRNSTVAEKITSVLAPITTNNKKNSKLIISSINGYVDINKCITSLSKLKNCKIEKRVIERKLQSLLKNNLDTVIISDEIMYIKEDFLLNEINLFKESISTKTVISEILKYLGKNVTVDTVRHKLHANFNCYSFSIIPVKTTYISIKEYELILETIENLKNYNYITSKELYIKLDSMFVGFELNSTNKLIKSILKKYNNKILPRFHFLNTTNYKLIPVDIVKKITNTIIEEIKNNKVKLFNITFNEYLSLSDKKFKEEYMILSREKFSEINNLNYTNIYIKDINLTFKNTDVKVIWIDKKCIYVSQKEFYSFLNFKNNYVVASSYFKKLGILFNSTTAKNNNIPIINHKSSFYIAKKDIDLYLSIHNFNTELSTTNSLYEKFKIKIKYSQNKNEINFPELKKYFLSFVKTCNMKSRTNIYLSRLFNIYNILLNNISVDLYKDNEEINNKLFRKTIFLCSNSQNNKTMLISFLNFLINNKGFKLNRMINISEKQSYEPYTKEQFLTLLTKLIEIMAIKEKREKLYGNWKLSTPITFIFLHYCLAWRTKDLIYQLPKPNLNLINGITDGKTFLKWINEGNELDYETAKEICNTLEKTTIRLRMTASKNNRELTCIIPDAFTKEIATLLCINEANRQVYPNKHHIKIDSCFISDYTKHSFFAPLLLKEFDIDINSILGDSFKNIRMTKGFMTSVKDKVEELGLAYGYYYAQILRNHTPTKNAFAETTKIYLQKDISQASLMAFATGTMGSVIYSIFKLIDNNFQNKSIDEQIRSIQSSNLTPYTAEKNIKIISNKISIMQSKIDSFFKNGGYKEGVLTELLYGQNSYGIEKRTKCLIKIINNSVQSANFNKETGQPKYCPLNRKSCIGCSYLISLRYFVYEFKEKFNKVMNDLEKAEEEIDKEIAIDSINELYLPLANDLALILGDEINKIIDTKRYLTLVKSI